MSTRSLERFIALNDEIAALARIGIPLDLGLRDLGREMPGRLGAATERLRQRLAEGQSLETAFRDACSDFPPAYQAIVAAGIRSGRLPQALESVSASTRHIVALRRTVRNAMIYPVFVVIIAYVLFVVFTIEWTPRLVDFFRQLTFSDPAFVQWMSSVSRTAQYWAPLVPIAFAVPIASWYIRSRRTVSHGRGRLRHTAHLATFAELLAALIENRVPLDEALTLAAGATDDRRLQQAGQEWAEQVRQGKPISLTPAQRGVIPDWLAWLLQHSNNQSELARNLAESGELYRREVKRLGIWYATVFPFLVTAAVGGSATLTSAVLILGPWFYILYRIGSP